MADLDVIRLDRPVEYGEVQLAPTTELAGLAELAALADPEDRVEVLLRVARALRDEDAERDRIEAQHRSGTAAPLPGRRAR